MKKAISIATIVGKVAHEPTSHTAQGTGKPYMILRVLNDEQDGGKFDFYCGSEWLHKKLVEVHVDQIVCVKARMGVRVNPGTNGGEFHNVNLMAEDVEIVGEVSAQSQAAPSSDEPF